MTRDNVKKFYLLSMAIDRVDLRRLLNRWERSLLGTTGSAVIATIQRIGQQMRKAAVIFATAIAQRHPDAGRVAEEYAHAHNKDAVACLLRRYCNTMEREVIDKVRAHATRTGLAMDTGVGWPTPGKASMLETAHDGVDWFAVLPHDHSVDAFMRKFTPVDMVKFGQLNVQFKTNCYRPTLQHFETTLGEWMRDKGLARLDSMRLSKVLPDPMDFMSKLKLLMKCFKTDPKSVNANTNYLDQVHRPMWCGEGQVPPI